MAYRRKDAFYRRAKDEGFRSRAAFKLSQIAKDERLIRRGDRVIDLGAWPGSWLQIACELVGPQGRVVGCDLRRIDALPGGVTVVTGDATSRDIQDEILEECGGRADVLLSDLAPKLSGIRDRDEAQATELVDSVLDFAARALRPGGNAVVKLFMNPSYERTVSRLKVAFERVRTTRPQATRKGSAEIYALAFGFRRSDDN